MNRYKVAAAPYSKDNRKGFALVPDNKGPLVMVEDVRRIVYGQRKVLFHFVIPLLPRTKKNSPRIVFKKKGNSKLRPQDMLNFERVDYMRKLSGAGRALDEFQKQVKGYQTQLKNITYFLVPSKIYKTYETSCLYHLNKYHGEPLTRVNLRAHYYRDTLRKVDLSNLHEALQDILVKAKVLLDDDGWNGVLTTDGSRVILDRKNPRTEFWLEEMPIEDDQLSLKL